MYFKAFFIFLLSASLLTLVMFSGCTEPRNISPVDLVPVRQSLYNQVLADENSVGVSDGNGVLIYRDVGLFDYCEGSNFVQSDENGLKCGLVSVPFGELNAIDSLVTIGSANTYYSVDVNAGLLNGFSLVDGNLVATYGGIYSVNSQWSFSGGVTNEYHLTLYKNGVMERKCHAERVLGTGGDVGSASFICLVELNAGDTLSPKIENATAGKNANVHDLQLTVVRIGN